MNTWKIGIIGGSGLYQLDALEDPQWHTVRTPWGDPSDALLTGRLAGIECVFLPRHGRGHVLGPTQLNYRANIDALKRLGVTDLVSISAVGSLREEMAPGDVVLVDQFIDRTFARDASFFGEGVVAHVSMAEPVCPRLSSFLADVRRQNIWHRSRRKLAECGPRLLLGFRRRAYGVASADVQWSVA